jgi:hypothetical protein
VSGANLTSRLTLLGFRSSDALKSKLNIKNSVVVVPDEGQLTGSSTFFVHLVERIGVKSQLGSTLNRLLQCITAM